VPTTLDGRVQAAAERAFAEHLADTPAEVSGAIVALDPATGGIRALIGGKDRRSDEFNVALHGARQGGSTFKVFTLAAWIEAGNSPESRFDAPAQVTVDTAQGPWEPRNYGGQAYGALSVREATWRSVNTVFAQMSEAVTPAAQVDIAKNGEYRETVESYRFFYRNFEDQPTAEMGVTTIGIDDVYVVLDRWEDSGTVGLRVFINPMVSWIWIGGGVFVVGMLALFWPNPKPIRSAQRKPARRAVLREA
jgi:membrane peptidoglycan carboxypeptidase